MSREQYGSDPLGYGNEPLKEEDNFWGWSTGQQPGPRVPSVAEGGEQLVAVGVGLLMLVLFAGTCWFQYQSRRRRSMR